MNAKISSRTKKYLKKQLATVVTVCVVLTVGSLFPSTCLPGWDALFGTRSPAGTAVSGTMEVHFIDVGNADCTLVRQGEHTLLIDAGERGDGDDILNYLRRLKVSRLDLVIATHPHADHIGGMTEVLEALPVGRFVMSFMPESETPTSATYLNMLEALDKKQIPVDEARPNQVYTVGEAKLQILAPLQESNDANDISVVSRLTFGQHAFLFTGDAGTAEERDILQVGHELRADVLKLGHHGSDTSSSQTFLDRVNPTYGVIPCGEGNSYGHPHRQTLDKLKAMNVTVYRSDMNGDIVFTSDGESLSVKTEG